MNIIEAAKAMERGEKVVSPRYPNEIVYGDCKWMQKGKPETTADWLPSLHSLLATDWEIAL